MITASSLTMQGKNHADIFPKGLECWDSEINKWIYFLNKISNLLSFFLNPNRSWDRIVEKIKQTVLLYWSLW